MAGSNLFRRTDCIRLYVTNLEEGLRFYQYALGLKLIWRTDTAIGLGMADTITELVIQTEDKRQEIDILVDSVIETVKIIEDAGGQIVYGPFDIKIGKCAVIRDPWDNKYVILDSTKGTFITDEDGNIIGQTIG